MLLVLKLINYLCGQKPINGDYLGQVDDILKIIDV